MSQGKYRGDKATTDERIALQEYDHGDLTDTVHASDSTYARSYHNDPSCISLSGAGAIREMERKLAKIRWLGPCRVCVLGDGGPPQNRPEP